MLEKLDGFLVSPLLAVTKVATKKQKLMSPAVLWATRQLRSPEVVDLVCRLGAERYDGFARHWIARGYTPLFECITPSVFKGVVPYERERLVLIAICHMASGVYAPWETAVASAGEFGIPVARTVGRVGDDESLDDVLCRVRRHLVSSEGACEGVVMVLADGQRRFKIKTDWYLDSTKLVSGVARCASRSGNCFHPGIVRWISDKKNKTD